MPQTRHRVFVVCVRHDLAEVLPDECLPRLEPRDGTVSVKGRDRSDCRDSAVGSAKATIAVHGSVPCAPPVTSWTHTQPVMSRQEEHRFRSALARARAGADQPAPPWRDPRGRVLLPRRCSPELRDWILDERIDRLPNNETRAHMSADLIRLPVCLGVCQHLRAVSEEPRLSEGPRAESRQLGHGQVRRPGTGCRSPTSPARPSPVTSPRTVTTSSTPIPVSAEASP